MKNAKKIRNIGDVLLVIGSLMYIYELLVKETKGLTIAICCVYAVSVVLMLIGWFGTKEERMAEKEAEKAEKEARKAAKEAKKAAKAA